MKKVYLTVTFYLFCLLSNAQEPLIAQLENAYNKNNYSWIISEHSKQLDSYPSKAVYYVALAYYMTSKDDNAFKAVNLSIKKNDKNPDAHFLKGTLLNIIDKPNKAILSFKNAIALDSTQCRYYTGIGNSHFYQEDFKTALEFYKKAITKEDITEQTYIMLPQVYANLNQQEEALQAFYKLKDVVSISSDSYFNALYNIGLYEYLSENYDKSEVAYSELISLKPNDYKAYTKLIQVYYASKKYDKATPLIDMLYSAYKTGQLDKSFNDMFCFDQFKWRDQFILAFEKFPVKKGELYYKHIFFVTDKNGKTQLTIQTENSPISLELGGPKYAIGADGEDGHSTFGFINENFKYNELKDIVIKILEKKITAPVGLKIDEN